MQDPGLRHQGCAIGLEGFVEGPLLALVDSGSAGLQASTKSKGKRLQAAEGRSGFGIPEMYAARTHPHPIRRLGRPLPQQRQRRLLLNARPLCRAFRGWRSGRGRSADQPTLSAPGYPPRAAQEVVRLCYAAGFPSCMVTMSRVPNRCVQSADMLAEECRLSLSALGMQRRTCAACSMVPRFHTSTQFEALQHAICMKCPPCQADRRILVSASAPASGFWHAVRRRQQRRSTLLHTSSINAPAMGTNPHHISL